MLILIAFICGVVMDVLWSKCVSAVTLRSAGLAANLSVGLYLCTVLSTVLIVENQWPSILAFIIGNWIGIYCTVRWWTK